MGRQFKLGVDYFPMDVNPDDKVKILEAEHDLIGFGVWVKLHQKIYASGYWIEWDKKAEIVFSKEINVCKNKVNDIINSCIEWEIFDKTLFDNYSVLTSRGIQKRYFKICERRSKIEIIQEYTIIDIPKVTNQEIINVNINRLNVNINPQNVCKSTQSKVKESKVKEKKIYADSFLKLWEDCPNSGDAKNQTSKNYDKTKGIYSWSDEQIYTACMNYYKIQEGKKNNFPYKLSNLIGEKYREILSDYINKNVIDETFSMEINGEDLA